MDQVVNVCLVIVGSLALIGTIWVCDQIEQWRKIRGERNAKFRRGF